MNSAVFVDPKMPFESIMCINYTMCNNCTMRFFPSTQKDLIRSVRGELTQADFAKVLGCDRSCLSRYENETLGAPTSVINYCLRTFATGIQKSTDSAWPLEDALKHARLAVAALESLQFPVTDKPSTKRGAR